jgi:hypothetical protein
MLDCGFIQHQCGLVNHFAAKAPAILAFDSIESDIAAFYTSLKDYFVFHQEAFLGQ